MFVQAALGKDGDRGWVYQGQSGSLLDVDPAESEEQKERRLERLHVHSSGAEQRHLRSLHHLRRAWLGSDPSARWLQDAEQELVQALAEDPEQAGAWNDLAVVHLSWASRYDRPRRLLDAYAASHAARALNPSLAEARFNQALALEGLGLFKDAAAVLDGPWPAWADAEKIANWRKELAAIDPVALREELLAKLEKAAEAGEVGEFLKQAEPFPQTARRWVEETLLPRWSEARLEGEEGRAAKMLEVAKAFGERIANPPTPKTLADPMLLESVLAITEASEQNQDGRLEYLTKGHQAFGRGMLAFPGRLEEAQSFFEQAEENFSRGRSPFASWAAFYQGACLHMQRYLPAAMRVFEGLRPESLRLPSLHVRSGWGRGLIFNHLDQLRAALEEYQATRELAMALEDGESVAAIAYQEAEVAAVLAQNEEAWRFLIHALRAAQTPLAARYRVNILFTAAWLSPAGRVEGPAALRPFLDSGLAELQGRFQNEAVQVAERSGLATFVAHNRSLLAASLEAQGRLQEAAEQWRLAALVTASISDQFTRERQLAELALLNAKSSSDEELGAAAQTFEDQGLDFRWVEAALILAQRAREQGKSEISERWLAQAQKVVEGPALGLEPVLDRHGYLQALQRVFRSRIAVAIESEGGAKRALELYLREQRFRKQAVGLSWPDRSVEAADAENVLPQLAKRTSFVAWLELSNDRLVALVLSADGIDAFPLSIGANELRSELAKLREKIGLLKVSTNSDSTRAVDEILEELSRHLIAPIEAQLPPEGELGVAFDEVFSAVPFEALLRQPGERRLIESLVVSRVPAPSIFARGPSRLEIPLQGGVVVGASEPAGSWGLDDLPGAESEVQRVRESLQLPQEGFFLGQAATQRNILGVLPEASWFHFAGHALEDPADPGSSLLILAEVEGERTALNVTELAAANQGQLKMAILAGCNTASSGTRSMAQVLARAGVPITIGSLWPVGDEVSAEFFKEFYQRLVAGVPPVQALHQTQLAALSSRNPQLASVASWAAFASWGW